MAVATTGSDTEPALPEPCRAILATEEGGYEALTDRLCLAGDLDEALGGALSDPVLALAFEHELTWAEHRVAGFLDAVLLREGRPDRATRHALDLRLRYGVRSRADGEGMRRALALIARDAADPETGALALRELAAGAQASRRRPG